MILVDNSKKAGAVAHLVSLPSLECCPPQIQQVFDAQRQTQFCSFVDDVLHLWIGLGDEESMTLSHVKNAAAAMAKAMRRMKQTEYQVDCADVVKLFGIDSVYHLTTGIALGLYEYAGFYSSQKPSYKYTAYLQGFEDAHQQEIQEIVTKSLVVADCTMMARDWVNTPGNYMNPQILSQQIAQAGQQAGCQVKVVDAQQTKQLKMELFLAIGQSSDSPCSVVVLRYMGNPDDKEVTALVGKGVTMDTGGYSLKSGKGMAAMKSDMGGAASVAAAICALARNQAKTNVVAVIPIVENRLSNSACTPGDVLTAMNGKTVEILSTDAEGRLILADALTYAVREEKADRVIDVATLTGAIVQAYGSVRAGVMTNDDLFEDELLRAAARAGEKFVDLPTDEEYFEIVKGDITDLVNSSRAGCGSIVAGLFLREFCEQRPWMHLDIAGTAWLDKAAHEYDGKGATGSPTATLYFLLDRHFTAADRF